MHNQPTPEQFARANGFSSFQALLTASRHISSHDGHEHFIAKSPNGQELEWDDRDFVELDVK